MLVPIILSSRTYNNLYNLGNLLFSLLEGAPDSLSVHFAGLHCCRRLGKFYRKSDYIMQSTYTPRNLAELNSSLVSRSAGPLPDGWENSE